MSLKADFFQSNLPEPKTIDKFGVIIPGIIDSMIRVSATSLPMEGSHNEQITIGGFSLNIPTCALYPGVWTCTVEESFITDVLVQLKALQAYQNLGTLVHGVQHTTTRYIRPIIYLLDQHNGAIPQYWATLKHCYLEKIEEPSLDWSKPDQPLRWKLTFRYSTISKFPLV